MRAIYLLRSTLGSTQAGFSNTDRQLREMLAAAVNSTRFGELLITSGRLQLKAGVGTSLRGCSGDRTPGAGHVCASSSEKDE